jgi:hypothetical protein
MSKNGSGELVGTLVDVGATIQATATFTKREFVVTYKQFENAAREEVIKFELKQDKTGLIDGFQPGQKIKVSYNLSGRQWVPDDGRDPIIFVTLHAWKIESAGQPQQGYQQPQQGYQVPAQTGYQAPAGS